MVCIKQVPLLVCWFFYVALNLVTFLLFVIDKAKAIRHQRRIPGRLLWLMIVLGGSGGALLGMMLARHKTKTLSFVLLVPALLLVHAASLSFLFRTLKGL